MSDLTPLLLNQYFMIALNAILLLGLVVFVLWFFIEARRDRLDPLDLLRDNGSKSVSVSKLGQLVGIFISSWVVLTLAKNSFPMLPEMFGIWLAYLLGGTSFNKWMMYKNGVAGTNNQPQCPADESK